MSHSRRPRNLRTLNKMKIELIYDADCPNLAAARLALIEASAKAGISVPWQEWERIALSRPRDDFRVANHPRRWQRCRGRECGRWRPQLQTVLYR
jgi:hypothetical protein